MILVLNPHCNIILVPNRFRQSQSGVSYCHLSGASNIDVFLGLPRSTTFGWHVLAQEMAAKETIFVPLNL